ncbi:MAG TPA: hypothetical protein VIS06_07875 [Mycobacteriales bacterium]
MNEFTKSGSLQPSVLMSEQDGKVLRTCGDPLVDGDLVIERAEHGSNGLLLRDRRYDNLEGLNVCLG